jgi:DNA-binding MurR/RpiR family transcriptional regulator
MVTRERTMAASNAAATTPRAAWPAGSPPADLLERLRRVVPRLAGNRRRVGEYVLNHAWQAQGLTISELAQQVGVAENSVSRFCHALGFAGYRDFSSALALALGRVIGAAYSAPQSMADSPADRDDWTVLTDVFSIEIQCLRDTLTGLDPTHWQAAVTAVRQAGRVLCVGMASTAPLAAMAAFRLNYVGIPAAWCSDPMEMLVQIGLLGPGDVALGISYTGHTARTVDALGLARQRRATAIGLTTVAGSLLAEAADIPLIIFGPNVALGHGQFAARVAGLAIIDALVAAVCTRTFPGIPPQVAWINDHTRTMNVPAVARRSRGAAPAAPAPASADECP